MGLGFGCRGLGVNYQAPGPNSLVSLLNRFPCQVRTGPSSRCSPLGRGCFRVQGFKVEDLGWRSTVLGKDLGCGVADDSSARRLSPKTLEEDFYQTYGLSAPIRVRHLGCTKRPSLVKLLK